MRAATFALLLLAGAALGDETDVLVYGATPAGIAAARAAAEDGERVLLVEPSSQIGGLPANGLVEDEFRTATALTGEALLFRRRIVEYYRPEFGDRAEEICGHGSRAEPKVVQAVDEALLAERPGITVRMNWALENAELSSEAEGDRAGPMKALEMVLFADPTGERHSVSARCFIDATYEGDLMAAAGVKYRVGREGRDEYHEALAPAEGDGLLPASSFHMVMTREAANRAPIKPPHDYHPEDFAAVGQALAAGRVSGVFGSGPACLLKIGAPLPHGKFAVGDQPGGLVRLCLPQENEDWPDGNGGTAIRAGATEGVEQPPFSRVMLAETRQQIMARHAQWTGGLLYFLQNDASVPPALAAEARRWGWCRDEYPENAHFPETLEVREARRMVGRYIFTQGDVVPAPGDTRAPWQREAIACGDFALRGGTTQGAGEGARGEFFAEEPPFQVPYDVLLPQRVENLLVPGAMSASHVGYGALAFEPVRIALGQAAGYAAHLAHAGQCPLADLALEKLQARLHAAGVATIYVADVPPGHPLFAAVQWWATLGGLHALQGVGESAEDADFFPGQRLEPAQPISTVLAERWGAIAKQADLESELPSESATRGVWIAAMYAQYLVHARAAGETSRDPRH